MSVWLFHYAAMNFLIVLPTESSALVSWYICKTTTLNVLEKCSFEPSSTFRFPDPAYWHSLFSLCSLYPLGSPKRELSWQPVCGRAPVLQLCTRILHNDWIWLYLRWKLKQHEGQGGKSIWKIPGQQQHTIHRILVPMTTNGTNGPSPSSVQQ